ncbi:MAG: ABC transporter substrate-binding protein, partial [Spirochaetaceae bacterium]|nr:ABC transporter substrate-binding protein [Spirochaetaceae bacterium]
MKKFIAALFCLCLFVSCAKRKADSEAPASVRVWTDSAGRVVEVPAKIERIAPSGPLAQIILYSLCPDKVIGWASSF